MSTPSPSKRPRIPTSSAVHSATASPFPIPIPSSTRPPPGPRSVGPSGSSAIFGMSPPLIDSTLSPAPGGTIEGISGFTPYSTTSPAYGNPSAASPISAALAHGSRVLSNIQAGSPFYTTPMLPQPRYTTIPPQPTVQPKSTPQQGTPERLRTALHHLQTLLGKLESEAEAFFDSVDSALAETADARVVSAKAKGFELAMSALLESLDKNGLASVPLLELPKDTQAKAEEDDTATTQTEAESSPALHSEIERLQQQAKDLFNRRQRFKESASIVGGILDS